MSPLFAVMLLCRALRYCIALTLLYILHSALLTFNRTDAGFGVIVDGVYQEATSFQSNVTHVNGTNQWIINFSPLAVGIFTMNVTVNSAPLTCPAISNLAFQVVPGQGYPLSSFIAGPNSTVAGSVVNYVISINDQWGNPIMRGLFVPCVSLASALRECGECFA